ncbi:MAG TPA: SCO family protein [Chthoniobacterales bacterium]|nr:SCO family protein [Chthoniobacterales bacterium]
MNANLLRARSARLGLLLTLVLTLQPMVQASAQSDPGPQTATRQNIPDLELVDQDGKTVHLYSDLVRGRVAAVSFIFTTCTSICPLIGANLGRLQTELGQSLGEDIALISVSVDPATDTPQRMKAWGAQFGAKSGWSLLTGDKETVDQLLKVFGLFTPDIQNHSPFLLLVNDRTGDWTRVNAIETPPPKVAEILRKMAETAGNRLSKPETEQTSAAVDTANSNPASPAERYFGDAVLTNQDGKQLRLYTDILKGNVVIVNSFYSTCNGVCRVTIPVFKQLQDDLGERVGKDVRLVSITADPESDTPEVLKRYAAGVGAKPGWDFLTGDKETVDQVLYKLGLYTEAKEEHSNIFIVGNEPTGLWKKVLGVAPPYEIRRSVESVLGDRN